MKSKRIFWMLFTILSILSSFPVSLAGAENARDIAKKAFPSVVILVMEDSAGQTLSLGSGFIIKEGVVATNLHVVAGAAKGYAKFVGQKAKYDISGFVAIDEQRDLVLLKIEDANAPVLAVGDSAKVSIGDEIFVIGNPQGLEGTFSKGIISAIRTIGEDSLLQITAPISPGSSGGPVLNEEGKVVGVAVATFKWGQNLNFAIPASYLSSLLTDTKPPRPLVPEKDAHKKAKSILSDLGGRNTEGVVGYKFRWDFPGGYPAFYSFSLQNRLREAVHNISCLVVFYDKEGAPIDFDLIKCKDILPAGLAKRLTSRVESSVRMMTTPDNSNFPDHQVEFRILDFQIVEESEAAL